MLLTCRRYEYYFVMDVVADVSTVEADRYSMLPVPRKPWSWLYDCAALRGQATAVLAIQELSESKSNSLLIVG